MKDARLERRRVFRHGRRRVCVPFFGDGSFSACSKGSCPIAKKALLKLIGARGPGFYLDEFKTSQMCTCGTSQLQDDLNHCHSRFRCHHFRPRVAALWASQMVKDSIEMFQQSGTCYTLRKTPCTVSRGQRPCAEPDTIKLLRKNN